MIKYLGSKRRLVPVLSELLVGTGAATALDLFTGTTRVARAFKQEGAEVTAVDTARYSEIFGRCYLEVDADSIDVEAIGDAIDHLNGLAGSAGYFTETFSRSARFFQPHNAERIDVIRDEIELEFSGSWMHPILLTSLILAADKVDSTTGVQMAYVKKWAPRSYKPMELRLPELIGGSGRAIRGSWGRSTWRISISPTTRIATSPTITFGRTSLLGITPSTTAWHASEWIAGTRARRASSIRNGRCPTLSPE
jgi:adenine-specific DNA-methyltransferase